MTRPHPQFEKQGRRRVIQLFIKGSGTAKTRTTGGLGHRVSRV